MAPTAQPSPFIQEPVEQTESKGYVCHPLTLTYGGVKKGLKFIIFATYRGGRGHAGPNPFFEYQFYVDFNPSLQTHTLEVNFLPELRFVATVTTGGRVKFVLPV